MTLLKSKPVQAVLVVVLAAAIVFTGTFAWNSFNQSRINVFKELMTPDTNLHDDFAGGPNKDVYVENSGDTDIYVRVRLTEFLKTEKRDSMVAGHLRDDDKAKWWAPHTGIKKDDGSYDCAACKLLGTDVASENWVVGGVAETFHDYYSWVLGGTENATGEIYYKPATAEQKGEYNADGTMLREPVVVSDPLTGTSDKLDAHLSYKEQVDALVASGKTEVEAMTELGIAKTLPLKGSMITMEQWEKGVGTVGDPDYRAPFAMGDYWVIDETDGWCYWANALQGRTATGLLLDKVERTDKKFDSNAEYCINVWLQAVDETDLGMFEVAGNGGISTNGKKLIQLATGKTVIGSDSAIYTVNPDGSFTMTSNTDGTPAVDAKPFIVLGVDASGKPLGVNAPIDNRIELNRRVTLNELVWDGNDYDNWDTIVGSVNNNWYNLTKSDVTDSNMDNGKQVYELIGTEKGRDGKLYLKLQPAKNDGTLNADVTLIVGSVTKSVAKTPEQYTQANPGAGPFAILYPGPDGMVGSGDDSRLDPSVDLVSRFFHHIGNGVYVETAEKGETNSKDNPIKYFFAGKILTKANVNNATSGDVDAKVNDLYKLQMAVGDKFDVTFDTNTAENTPVTAYAPKTDGKYTMQELTKGSDSNLYIYLGTDKLGYISVGGDNYLGNNGDTRRWAGKFGIGGTDDPKKAPSDFTEGFLQQQGKQSEDLKAGGTFTADGKTWMVLDVDKYGNRFIISQNYDVFTSFGSTNVYQGSALQAAMKNFYNTKIPTLKPYVQDVSTPTETGTWSATMEVQENALSSALASKSNPTAFILSQSEYNKYEIEKKSAGASVGGWFWSRTPSSTGNVSNFLKTSTTTRQFIQKGIGNTGIANLPAAWVRFSDADLIAIATQEEMDIWKSMPKVGSSVTFGNYPQNQTAETPKQPIQWKVLDVQGTKVLLLANSALDSAQMGTTINGYNQWSTTPVRTFLNGTFKNTAFTAEEQDQILTTKVKTTGLTDTEDKIFIPSVEELAYYPGNNAATCTAYAKSKAVGKGDWYWLRSRNNGYAYFWSNGSISKDGQAHAYVGLRPMMWVDYGK